MINNEIGERWRNERRVLEKFQGGFDDGVLTRRVVRPVERISVPERHEQRARRTHTLGHFAKELNCHGRNAPAFKFGGGPKGSAHAVLESVNSARIHSGRRIQ